MDVLKGKESAEAVLGPALSYKVYYLVGIWLESLLYGVYLCLFAASLSIVRKRNSSTPTSRFFLAGVLSMFVLITFHNSVNVYRLINAFAYQLDPAASFWYLVDLQTWDGYAFPVILALLTWIGDTLVIFRCFLIWDRNPYIVALPCFILFVCIVVTSVNLVWFRDMTSLPPETIRPFLNMTFPLNFAQNVLTTGLIILKIWIAHTASRTAGLMSSASLSLMDVVWIIVESALVYTTQMLLLVILFAIGHPSQVVVQHALVPSTGIVFVLIFIRTNSARVTLLQTSEDISVVPSWLNRIEAEERRQADSETRRMRRWSSIPFVTTAVEQHHLEDISKVDPVHGRNIHES